jgi:hypothetical protein
MSDIKLIKIRMKENCPGSPNGYQTFNYKKGEEYSIPEKLADVFLNTLKVAERVIISHAKKQVEEYDEDLVVNKKNAPNTRNKKIMGEDSKEDK